MIRYYDRNGVAHYGRQTRELEYKHRREEREKQLEKMDQE